MVGVALGYFFEAWTWHELFSGRTTARGQHRSLITKNFRLNIFLSVIIFFGSKNQYLKWGSRFFWSHGNKYGEPPSRNSWILSVCFCGFSVDFCRFSIDFWSAFWRFPIDFWLMSDRFLIDFRSMFDRFSIDFWSIFNYCQNYCRNYCRFSIDFRSILDRFLIDLKISMDRPWKHFPWTVDLKL